MTLQWMSSDDAANQRRRATSGRFCSLAETVFLWDWCSRLSRFHRNVADDDPTLGEFICERPDREVRLIGDPAHQPAAL